MAGAELLVVLDGVEDPHNLGAIIRTAHAAGAGAVVIPERRAAGLTDVVAKAAAGALEHLPVVRVTNINRALEDLKERGFWIYGLDESGAEDYDARGIRHAHGAGRLGGEGKGLHEQVRKHCDVLVRIPMAGKISSLNVSVAAGVVLFEWKQTRARIRHSRIECLRRIPERRAEGTAEGYSRSHMKHALSTHLFVNHRLTTASLDPIEQAGIPAVEIFCARQHLDYRDKAQIAELGHWFRDSELKLHSLHAPMYTDEIWGRSGPHAVITITEPVKAQRLQMVDEIKRALEIAEIVPFRYLIQHMGVGGEEFDMRKFDAAFSALEELSLFARPARRGDSAREHSQRAFERRAAAAVRGAHPLGLNYVFDTGHAHMDEGVEAAFDVMKERIRSTHVHDNDGKERRAPVSAPGDGRHHRLEEAPWSCCAAATGQYPLLLELKEQPGD